MRCAPPGQRPKAGREPGAPSFLLLLNILLIIVLSLADEVEGRRISAYWVSMSAPEEPGHSCLETTAAYWGPRRKNMRRLHRRGLGGRSNIRRIGGEPAESRCTRHWQRPECAAKM